MITSIITTRYKYLHEPNALNIIHHVLHIHYTHLITIHMPLFSKQTNQETAFHRWVWLAALSEIYAVFLQDSLVAQLSYPGSHPASPAILSTEIKQHHISRENYMSSNMAINREIHRPFEDGLVYGHFQMEVELSIMEVCCQLD